MRLRSRALVAQSCPRGTALHSFLKLEASSMSGFWLVTVRETELAVQPRGSGGHPEPYRHEAAASLYSALGGGQGLAIK